MRKRPTSWTGVVVVLAIVLWFGWTQLTGHGVLVPGTPPGSHAHPGGASSDWLRPQVRVGSRVVIPYQVLSGLLIAILVLSISRALLRRRPSGPIRLTDIVLFEPDRRHGQRQEEKAFTPATITALIMECLQVRNVRAHGVIPSYSGIDARSTDLQGAPAFPQPGGLLTRTLAALGQSSVVNLGFTVTVTQTPAQAPYAVGLTFSVQRVATGAIELVETCWASSLEEGARKVGFRLVAWREESQQPWLLRFLGLPVPTPNASSMRHQHAAVIEGWHRRYDRAVHFAREGLRVDPGNVGLRLHLGETYERLGLGLDAMIAYASGLIGLDDTRNGWRNGGPHPAQAEAVVGRRRVVLRRDPQRRRRLANRDADSAGLLWRYIANLGMAERWADLLVAETARVDDLYRHPHTSAGDHPWYTPHSLVGWPPMPSASVDVGWSLSEARERSGLVRGFVAKRYATILGQHFPLFHAAWLEERGPREDPFPEPSSIPAPSVELQGQLAVDWRLPSARRSPHRVVHPGLESQQVGDLVAALHALEAIHRHAWHPEPTPPGMPANRVAAAEALIAGTKRCFTAALTYVIADNPDASGTPGEISQLESRALRALASREPEVWKAWRLNRSLVIAVVTRLMTQLSAVHRYVGETYLRRETLTPPGALGALDATMCGYSELFGRVAASLDVQMVLSLCAMDDLEQMLAGKAETPPLADRRRSQLLWVMAHHRYRARMLYLERANGFTSLRDGQDQAFLTRAGAVMQHTHDQIRQILTTVPLRRVQELLLELESRVRWHRPILGRSDEPWSLSYYAACAYAVTIPDYPGSVDGEANPIRGGSSAEPHLTVDSSYHKWCRTYDGVAELAIHHLDQAVAWRARSRRTGRTRGVADWILDEDPDLDLLRRHPRFRRWAAQRFQVSIVPEWRSPAFRAMRSARFERSIELPHGSSADRDKPRTLMFQESCALGVLGSSVPWNRSYVRWGLTHTHYLVLGLFATLPVAINRMEKLAREVGSPPGQGAGSNSPRELSEVADQLVRFWSAVPLYRSMNNHPELRLETGTVMRGLAGLQDTLWPQFPREADVLIEARFLDFTTLDQRLQRCAPRGLESAVALQRLIDTGGSDGTAAVRTAQLIRRCGGQLGRLLGEVEASMASPPSRLSLRRRYAEGGLPVGEFDDEL